MGYTEFLPNQSQVHHVKVKVEPTILWNHALRHALWHFQLHILQLFQAKPVPIHWHSEVTQIDCFLSHDLHWKLWPHTKHSRTLAACHVVKQANHTSVVPLLHEAPDAYLVALFFLAKPLCDCVRYQPTVPVLMSTYTLPPNPHLGIQHGIQDSAGHSWHFLGSYCPIITVLQRSIVYRAIRHAGWVCVVLILHWKSGLEGWMAFALQATLPPAAALTSRMLNSCIAYLVIACLPVQTGTCIPWPTT